MKKVLALVLVLCLCLGICLEAFAATSQSYTFKTEEGSSNYVRIVTSKNNATFTISIPKRTLQYANKNTNWLTSSSCYPPFEVKIWNSAGTMILDQDIWKSSSKTFTLPTKGTYKVQIYSWRPMTTAKSYFNNGSAVIGLGDVKTDLWLSAPKVTVSNKSGCSSIATW